MKQVDIDFINVLIKKIFNLFFNVMPSLNLLYHSKTDAQFMQDGRKAV